MMLLPYKLDHRLYHQPWVTYAIAVLCLGIYYIQSVNTPQVEKAVESFCEQNHGMTFTDLIQRASEVHKLINSSEHACQVLISVLHAREQPHALIKITAEDEVNNHPENKYTVSQLELGMSMAYMAFRNSAPTDITGFLSYEAGSFNPFSAFVSAFAHADWSHVIGNPIFFLALAGAVEASSGIPVDSF